MLHTTNYDKVQDNTDNAEVHTSQGKGENIEKPAVIVEKTTTSEVYAEAPWEQADTELIKADPI